VSGLELRADSGFPPPAIAEIDAAWDSEIARRLAAYDRGEVVAIDAQAVFAKAMRIAQ
jgi:hypothetical protein